MNKSIIAMEKLIAQTYGKTYFNFTEIAKILGVGKNTISSELHSAGVTIKRMGNSKIVSAYDLAEFMEKSKVSPIDK